jgi:hypothetical protein
VRRVTGRAFSCSRRFKKEPVTAKASSLMVSSGFGAGAWANAMLAVKAEAKEIRRRWFDVDMGKLRPRKLDFRGLGV